MSDTNKSSLQYFVIIAGQKKKDKFIQLLNAHGARGVSIVYGHGSMSRSALAAAFGIGAESGRALISCLVKRDQAEKLVAALYKDYDFDKPNTGIAFSIPVEGLAF